MSRLIKSPSTKRELPIMLLIALFLLIPVFATSQNNIEFYQTSWGKDTNFSEFCKQAKKDGYVGIETRLPESNKTEQEELKKALKDTNLKLIVQAYVNTNVPIDEALLLYEELIELAVSFNAEMINSHTGHDFFSVEDNMKFINLAKQLSEKHHIPIYHETHRSRMNYSVPVTNHYLSLDDQFMLTLDISHWMVVHESLLEGKDDFLTEILDRTRLIHARVGHYEGPQVNDPRAPEWKKAVDRHMDIWEEIIRKTWSRGETMKITTEFGPAGYLPTLPYTQQPVSDQWEANFFIMKAIKERMKID